MPVKKTRVWLSHNNKKKIKQKLYFYSIFNSNTFLKDHNDQALNLKGLKTLLRRRYLKYEFQQEIKIGVI